MSDNLIVTKRVHFTTANKGRRQIKPGPMPVRDTVQGRIPRLARLMALAIKFDQLLTKRAVLDQAEMAELGHVTRARVTQIMNLLHLAPDIQEEILYLAPVVYGKDPLTERHLRPITKILDWNQQRKKWSGLKDKAKCYTG